MKSNLTLTGFKIKKYRKEQKLSQESLGKSAGKNKRYVCELENGAVKKPSAPILLKLADRLGISFNFLLDDNVLVPNQTHKDEAFYRSYLNLDEDSKIKMRHILSTYIKNKKT